MNSVIRSLTFHSDGQKRSAAPLVQEEGKRTVFQTTLSKGIPAYGTFRFTRQTTVIIKTVIAGSVSEEEILVHSSITKHVKHVIEQLTADTHAPRFRRNREQRYLSLIAFAGISLQHFIDLQNRNLIGKSSTTILACQQGQRQAISRNSMTYPLRRGNTGPQRSQYHAKHPTITFSDRSLGGARKKIMHVDCRKSVHIAQTNRLAQLVLTQLALIVRNIPVIIRLIIRIPSLSNKLFKRRKIRATHRPKHNRF